MDRFVCIHGHFYQPPRENPWLGEVEAQESAHPYHDWNERITAECYAPNTAARILNPEGEIVDIVNNYAGISFNVGPTLLAWMEWHHPDTYRAILESDRISRNRFAGHGAAIAQAYHHIVLPLAGCRDKRTQILWGIEDFVHRFGRYPEGFWLPETAVDLESLDILAEYGIRFTVLSNYQASRIRSLDGGPWQDVSGGRIDTTMPYTCTLPSGRSLAVFFYDGPVSQRIAFSDLLSNGERLAESLIARFTDRAGPQLVHVATDGETYGHHRKFGEMALAYCLRTLASRPDVQVTVYGEYLERAPPTHEAEIIENSSWSCSHGVERWRADCGCSMWGHPGWSQAWRRPLRQAMDYLRDACTPLFERAMTSLGIDPWRARDGYIALLLDPAPERREQFLAQLAQRELSAEEQATALQLLEMQRHAMLMYVSCGWFFDDIASPETVYVLQHAARAMQIARIAWNTDLEPRFCGMLARAPANSAEYASGADVYAAQVAPRIWDPLRVGARYAFPCLVSSCPERQSSPLLALRCDGVERFSQGAQALSLGRFYLQHIHTGEEIVFFGAAVTEGIDTFRGGVRECSGDGIPCRAMADLLLASWDADKRTVATALERCCPSRVYGLEDLLPDERREVSEGMLRSARGELEALFRRFSRPKPAVVERVLQETRPPLQGILHASREYLLNLDLRRALQDADLEPVRELVQALQSEALQADALLISAAAGERITRILEMWRMNPSDSEPMADVVSLFAVLRDLPLSIDLWQAQNIYFSVGTGQQGVAPRRAEAGDREAEQWLGWFQQLGERLHVKIL